MTDLVTVDEFKEAEGMASNTRDTQLEFIVPSVSQLVKTYCSRTFRDYYSTPKVETISVSWETDMVSVDEIPIISVSSIRERDLQTRTWKTLTESTDYFVDTSIDTIYRLGKDWEVGPGAVEVTYTAGFSSVPLDLRLAVFDLIRYYLEGEYKEAKSLSGATVRNDTTATGSLLEVPFPPHIKRVLDLYKIQT